MSTDRMMTRTLVMGLPRFSAIRRYSFRIQMISDSLDW
jgi:hypothetical protein